MLTQSLHSIGKGIDNYLPQDKIHVAAQSFVLSASMSLLVTGVSAKTAFIAGTLAATATLVESVARPILHATFPEWGLNKKNWVTFLVTHSLITSLAIKPLEILTGCTYTTPSFLKLFLGYGIMFSNECMEVFHAWSTQQNDASLDTVTQNQETRAAGYIF